MVPVVPIEPPTGYTILCNSDHSKFKWKGPSTYLLKDSVVSYDSRQEAIDEAWVTFNRRHQANEDDELFEPCDDSNLPITKRIEGMTATLTDGTMYQLDATLTNWVNIGKSNALKTLP